jgi:hypothetical protein
MSGTLFQLPEGLREAAASRERNEKKERTKKGK